MTLSRVCFGFGVYIQYARRYIRSSNAEIYQVKDHNQPTYRHLSHPSLRLCVLCDTKEK